MCGCTILRTRSTSPRLSWTRECGSVTGRRQSGIKVWKLIYCLLFIQWWQWWWDSSCWSDPNGSPASLQAGEGMPYIEVFQLRKSAASFSWIVCMYNNMSHALKPACLLWDSHTCSNALNHLVGMVSLQRVYWRVQDMFRLGQQSDW